MTTPGTSTLRLVVAINPSASFGATRAVGPSVVQQLEDLGHSVTSLSEGSFASLRDAALAAVRTSPDAVIVVGGDGMVNLGINLVAGTGIPLGIIPSGTGNDMARGLGIPLGDPSAAIALALGASAAPARTIDLGRMTRADGTIHWFGCVLSAGFDAVVNERANQMHRPKGKSRYTLALLLELVRLRSLRYELVLDGVASVENRILVAVGNNSSFGGGMHIAPDASLTDGLLDVVTLEPVNRRQLLTLFPRIFSGTHINDPRVRVRRVKSLSINAPGIVAYADGERMGPLPIDVTVVPGALTVLA